MDVTAAVVRATCRCPSQPRNIWRGAFVAPPCVRRAIEPRRENLWRGALPLPPPCVRRALEPRREKTLARSFPSPPPCARRATEPRHKKPGEELSVAPPLVCDEPFDHAAKLVRSAFDCPRPSVLRPHTSSRVETASEPRRNHCETTRSRRGMILLRPLLSPLLAQRRALELARA